MVGNTIGLALIEQPNYMKPDPFDESKDSDDYSINGWYARNALFYLRTYYNRYSASWNEEEIQNLPIVTRGRYLAKYLYGEQDNIRFRHFTKDVSGNNLQVVWEPGKETADIYMSHLGNYQRQLEYKRITATTLSRDVVIRRNAYIESAKLQADKEFMNLVKSAGIGFQGPIQGQGTLTERKAEEIAAKQWKDKAAVNCVKLALDIQETEHMDEKMESCFADYYAANFTGVYIPVENGRPKVRPIPFYNLFYEKCENDPLNRNMKAAGFIDQLTETEILSRYKVSETQSTEIKEAFRSLSTNAGIYNVGNVNWYNTGTTVRAGTIAVVTCFFIAPKRVEKEKVVDRYGNVNYVTPKKKGTSTLVTNELYYCIIAGNRWVLECGPANNVVRSATNKSDPQLPIIVFDGFNIVGNGISMAGLTAQLQDHLDFCRYKIKEKMARDKGIVYMMDGSKLNSLSDNPKRLATDFASLGFTVVNGASGEYGDGVDFKGGLVATMDFRLDATGLQTYTNEYIFTFNQMREIAKMSAIAAGNQTQYVSEEVRRQSVSASQAGVLFMMKGMTRFEEMIIQYATNAYKMVIYKKKSKENVAIGRDGAMVLEKMGDWLMEDVLIWLKTDDVMDDKERQVVNGLLQAYIQNSQNPQAADATKVALGIIKATTYQEAQDDLEDYLNKQNDMQAEAAKREERLKAAEMANSRDIVKAQTDAAIHGKVIDSNTKLTEKQAELEQADNMAAQQPI